MLNFFWLFLHWNSSFIKFFTRLTWQSKPHHMPLPLSFDMKTMGPIKVYLYDVETFLVLYDVLWGGIWFLPYHMEVTSLLSWSWQGIHTLSLECNKSYYYNLCASLEIRHISSNFFCKLWKCIAHAVLFLKIVNYVQWTSFPYNSSLQILRQVWHNAINLHMQAHMQNSQKISDFICQSRHLHIQLSVYFDLYLLKSFLLNENINFTSSWIMS